MMPWFVLFRLPPLCGVYLAIGLAHKVIMAMTGWRLRFIEMCMNECGYFWVNPGEEGKSFFVWNEERPRLGDCRKFSMRCR